MDEIDSSGEFLFLGGGISFKKYRFLWVPAEEVERMREGIGRDFGMDMYTPLYLKWITNKALLYSTGNSAQCFVVTRMEEGFGKNGSMYLHG